MQGPTASHVHLKRPQQPEMNSQKQLLLLLAGLVQASQGGPAPIGTDQVTLMRNESMSLSEKEDVVWHFGQSNIGKAGSMNALELEFMSLDLLFLHKKSDTASGHTFQSCVFTCKDGLLSCFAKVENWLGEVKLRGFPRITCTISPSGSRDARVVLPLKVTLSTLVPAWSVPSSSIIFRLVSPVERLMPVCRALQLSCLEEFTLNTTPDLSDS